MDLYLVSTIVVIVTGITNVITGIIYLADKFSKRDIQFRDIENRHIRNRLSHSIRRVLRSRIVQTMTQQILELSKFLLGSFATAVIIFLVSQCGESFVSETESPTSTPQVSMPSPTPRVTLAPTPPHTPFPSPTATPFNPTPAPIPTPSRYAVQHGDTYDGIANRFNISAEILMDFNDVFDPSDIFPDKVLRIPTHLAHITEHRKMLNNTIVAVVNAESGLNVRDSPSIYGRIQRVALVGSRLTLTGASKDDNGSEWFELTSGEWVQGQYLYFFGRVIVMAPDGLLSFDKPHVWARSVRLLSFEEQVHLTGRFHEADISWVELRGGGWVQRQHLRIELTTDPPLLVTSQT